MNPKGSRGDLLSTEQTTASLPRLEVDADLLDLMIERGNFKECRALITEKYGELAPVLLVAAASGPTCTVGQMATLWRAIVERPLLEFTPLSEVIWEGLSLTLERGLLISTQHQRFIRAEFSISTQRDRKKWRERWEGSVS